MLNTGLFLQAADLLLPRGRSFLALQWEERLDKWKLFSDMQFAGDEDRRLLGLLVSRSLVDDQGAKIPTSIPGDGRLFSLTDDPSGIEGKLLEWSGTAWTLPEAYIDYLSQSVFGLAKEIQASEGRRIQKAARSAPLLQGAPAGDVLTRRRLCLHVRRLQASIK